MTREAVHLAQKNGIRVQFQQRRQGHQSSVRMFCRLTTLTMRDAHVGDSETEAVRLTLGCISFRGRWSLRHDELDERAGTQARLTPRPAKRYVFHYQARGLTMKPVVAALAVCGFVLTALPVVATDATANAAAEEAAPQDAPMSREQRIQVQQGLAALGFDPGPADGLFGPKTRAAIWDWQNAKGLEATGFLAREEAEALGAMGLAAEAYNEESDPEVAEPDDAASEESAPEPPGSQNLVLYFPQCSGLDELPPDDSGCWQAISNRQQCDFFLPRWEFAYRKGQITWSGVCRHNAAHGSGTLEYDYETGDGTRDISTLSGTFVEGRRQGDWVLHVRFTSGTELTLEGPYVDGVMNGHWVIWGRLADGVEVTREGPFVHGAEHGLWVQRNRSPDGTENTVNLECHHGVCEEQ